MTKSEIFKKAHSIAKSTVAIVGNYAIAFSIALKEIYSSKDEVMFSEDLLDEMFFVNMDQACFGDFSIVKTVDGGIDNFAFAAVGMSAVLVLQNGDIYNYEHHGKETGNSTWNGDDVMRKEVLVTYELKRKIGKVSLIDGDIEDVAFNALEQVSEYV